MDTAISGLNGQAAAFGNISDNVANSQTVGFKRVDTAFTDYLTTSNATVNESGAVVAHPDYVNNVQGTVKQTDNPLGMAITGQGFFSVNEANSTGPKGTTFSLQQYYTRAGDFSMNKDGYLVNSAGEYLDGWTVDPTTGAVNRGGTVPIQVSQNEDVPVATTTMQLSANLPATPTATTPISSPISVYDSLGTPHALTLAWTQNADSDWTVAISSPANLGGALIGTAEVKFGANSGNPVPEGTVGSVGVGTGGITPSSYAAGTSASLSLAANFGNGAQTIVLSLGQYGASTGLTQYAGTDYTPHGLDQNGIPPGSFSSVSTTSSGDVIINYDNGKSRVVAQIPITTFNNPNALQRKDGQAFTASTPAGGARQQSAGNNGAGSIVTNSVEQSNVDIATEFTKLIVAQRAYSASTKVITTAEDLLQQTIDMKR